MKTLEDIREYLVINRDSLSELTAPYTALFFERIKEEDPVFHLDIQRQYVKLVQEMVIEQVSKDVGVDAGMVHEVIDEINLRDYLESEIP